MENKNIGFKVTVEYICNNMIEAETLREHFNNIATSAYEFISDGCGDSPTNFSSSETVVKVEVIREKLKYKCLLCGRSKFDRRSPHKCVGGYRKRGLKWELSNGS